MLRLIMKYDLRDCFRQSLPLLTGVVILAPVSCGLLYFAFNFTNAIVTVTLTALYALAMFSMLIALLIASLSGPLRYYKSLFTDEGYLSMSIPVNTRTLVNAKLLSAVVFECAMLLASVLAFSLSTVLPAALYDGEKLFSILESLVKFATRELSSSPAAIALYLLSFFVEFIAQTVILLSSVTVGSLVVRKHRMLGSLGCFLVINMALGVTEIIVSWLIEVTVNGSVAAVILPIVFSMVSLITVAVILYFINVKLMTKSFNIL